MYQWHFNNIQEANTNNNHIGIKIIVWFTFLSHTFLEYLNIMHVLDYTIWEYEVLILEYKYKNTKLLCVKRFFSMVYYWVRRCTIWYNQIWKLTSTFSVTHRSPSCREWCYVMSHVSLVNLFVHKTVMLLKIYICSV